MSAPARTRNTPAKPAPAKFHDDLANTILSNFLSVYIRFQPIFMLEIAVFNKGPFILSSIFCSITNGMRMIEESKNVIESMMKAASVPYSLTTTPPSIAPVHSAVDQEALPIAFAVIKSSSATILGTAALSAVTYTPCSSIIMPETVISHHISSGPSTRMNDNANPI